jgi:uncharacterized delta-60 repeat protein
MKHGARCRSVLAWLALVLISSGQRLCSQALDTFDPSSDGSVYAIAVEPGGKLLLGGAFLHLAGQSRSHIARIGTDGTIDATFDPGADGPVHCFAVQEDGSIVVGGAFTNLCGNPRNHIGRLNADGSLDMSFNPGADSSVGSIALDAEGRILIGGSFTNVAGQPRSYIARLYSNGSLDMAFSPAVAGWPDHPDPPFVCTVAFQPDGKILLGGEFATLNGQQRYAVGRLHSDGTLDTNFNAAVDWFVAALVVQPDGHIMAAGGFQIFNAQPRPGIARLNGDGTLDAGFNTEHAPTLFDPALGSIAVQADGKVAAGELGGGFVLPNAPPMAWKYNTHGRIETNSSVVANSDVSCVALQADGRILVGGLFTMLGGQTRNHLGRLTNLDAPTENLSFDNSSVTWLRGGASPEAWRTSFAWSTNGTSWINLGPGTHIPGGWQISQISLPTNATVRARAFVTGGSCNGSTWFVERLLGPQVQPIIVNDATLGFRTNKFEFGILASIGRTVVVDASTNLTQWTPLITNIMASGLFSFSDPYATNFPARFYCVRSE